MISDYLKKISNRCDAVLEFHEQHKELINTVPGSSGNHQNWTHGYYDHIVQCFEIAQRLYFQADFPFSFESVIIVLYFHDIEKLWRGKDIDKENYYKNILPESYSIKLTDEELNALKYIHGEGDDYKKDMRVMNELAAFCHCCDVISARCFHDKNKINWK